MRKAKIGFLALLAATLFWSELSSAGLEEVYVDGWHTWQVLTEDGDAAQFLVLVEGGKLSRIHSLNWNCRKPTREAVTDHGTVSPGESYAWFRAVVEDSGVDGHVRDAALFGLVESGTDEALEYIDRILSQR